MDATDLTRPVRNPPIHELLVPPPLPGSFLLCISGPQLGELFALPDGQAIVGRGRATQVRLPAEGVSRQHALLTPGRGAFSLRDLGSRNGTFVNGERRDQAELRPGDQVGLGPLAVVQLLAMDGIEERFRRGLYESALRDGLTGSYNRRYFTERLRAEVAYAERHQAPLSLLLVDVDHFKQINDRFGHNVGDEVLRRIAQSISGVIRLGDVLFRIGGEEFSVLCRGQGPGGAQRCAERVRRTVEIMSGGQFTVSVGVASLAPSASSCDRLVEDADAALYQAKGAGRNCVRVMR